MILELATDPDLPNRTRNKHLPERDHVPIILSRRKKREPRDLLLDRWKVDFDPGSKEDAALLSLLRQGSECLRTRW